MDPMGRRKASAKRRRIASHLCTMIVAGMSWSMYSNSAPRNKALSLGLWKTTWVFSSLFPGGVFFFYGKRKVPGILQEMSGLASQAWFFLEDIYDSCCFLWCLVNIYLLRYTFWGHGITWNGSEWVNFSGVQDE